MRQTVILILLAGLVFAAVNSGPAQAQLECTDPDLIAVVFSDGEVNFDPVAFVPYDIQVRLLNPTATEGFNAFEFKLVTPPNH